MPWNGPTARFPLIMPALVLLAAMVLPLRAQVADSSRVDSKRRGSARQRLDITLEPGFGEKALAFDTLALETAAGQAVSLTRLDLLLSSAALRRPDGTWISSRDWAAFVNTREGRTSFAIDRIPAGKFTGLRFTVGLPPEINKGDPARYPAGHALNPVVNGMHWGWQGGYVFMAVEGLWRDAGGRLSGYSWHLANDGNTATVEFPLELDLTRDQSLRLALDARVLFGRDATELITAETATTHSRSGDPLAARLLGNIPAAFKVVSLQPTPDRTDLTESRRALIAPGAKPYAFTIPKSFPRPPLPIDNPLTVEGVALGKRLFDDKTLSGNQSISCSSCHVAEDAFSDGRRFSIGAYGDHGRRQSMPLFNLAWKSSFFWDGRAATLRDQVLHPIRDRAEMSALMPDVIARLKDSREYPALFARAFGSGEIDQDRLARALEQFLLTLVSRDSKFDRSLRGEVSLTEEEKRGFQLFNTEFDPARGQYGADCFHCHGGSLFQSMAFANNGLPGPRDLDGPAPDLGRYEATGLDGDKGKFAVPSLRNVALTGPYMHDGRFATLEQVINHYSHGVRPSPTLDPNLAKHPPGGLRIPPEDKQALLAFLKTLTDPVFSKTGRVP